MIFVVRREVNVLNKIERRKKRQKLRGESVCRIIEMNVEVTGDDKFMGSGCSKRKKRTGKQGMVWNKLTRMEDDRY